MGRGFIVGLIVGLLGLAGLMVLFPMSVETPMTPELGAVEDSAASGDKAAEEAPEAGAPATPETPETPETLAPAPGSETAPADQGRAPEATGVEETAAIEGESGAGSGESARGEGEGGLHLPTVARPADTLKAPVGGPEGQPAWRRNAVAFDASDGRPLLAVVLTLGLDTPVSTTPLGKVGAPLTLAVPPTSREGASAARLYRRAGYETLLLLALTPAEGGGVAPGLSDAEIAEAVRGLIEDFDSVVGLANPGAAKKPEMRVARAVMRELAVAGLGYLHADGGAVGAEVRAAEENGVAIARHVRVIEPGLSESEVLKALDLAAFDARRRGAAVAMGAPTEAMVRALIDWAKDNDGRAARLAPFSAVLARLAQEG